MHQLQMKVFNRFTRIDPVNEQRSVSVDGAFPSFQGEAHPAGRLVYGDVHRRTYCVNTHT